MDTFGSNFYPALMIGIAGVVIADSSNDIDPILCASSFECSSSDLAEDFPPSVLKQTVMIANCEQLLFKFNKEFGQITAAECVDVFLDFIAFTILE